MLDLIAREMVKKTKKQFGQPYSVQTSHVLVNLFKKEHTCP